MTGTGFSGNYDEYFGLSTDTEAVVYLMMANKLLREQYPFVITVAEVCKISFSYQALCNLQERFSNVQICHMYMDVHLHLSIVYREHSILA